MKIIPGGVTSPVGFKAAGLHVGIRKNKMKKDMAMLLSDVPANVAGVFTLNAVQAAPVIWDKKLVAENGKCQALVVNSGVANTCTGQAGYQDVVAMAEYTAAALGINKELVAVASTGVIGMRLPMETVFAGIDMLIPELDSDIDSGTNAANAIMTTDLYKKEIAVTLEIKGKQVTIGGMCKGSGMINPNLGTVLSFITTDLNISTELLGKVLKKDVPDTYNMVSVDGDMSTNDTVMIFANGMAGNEELTEEDEDFEAFVEAVRYINTSFVKKIASDGEGATKMFQVDIAGMSDKESARKLAKAIVSSNLVKCAMYGEDANWGRIVCAMGQSGISFDPYKVDIIIASVAGQLRIVQNGTTTDYDEKEATRILSEKQIRLIADMNMGEFGATAWGCDMTYDYIRINADYRK
ncbi:MAG: bifunctional glutamate N-acetyltransferase/amino-acid acetyltransferase ArgJ [Coprococcus sp.]|nr:bifunctional glutamate N-acetyltransferase/amino-acid acetyltransferase ArgJ [Coprococcus sp.]